MARASSRAAVLALLLCLALTLPARAAEDNGAVPDLSQELIWQGRLAEMQTLADEAQAQLKRLREAAAEPTKAVSEAAAAYQQLFALTQVSRSQPFEQSALERRAAALEKSLTRRLAALKAQADTARQRQAELDALAKELPGEVASETDAAIERTFRDYLSAIDRARSALARNLTGLDKVLKPGTQLAEKLAKLRADISGRLPGLWRAYYLTPGPSLFDLGAFQAMPQGLQTWIESIPVRLVTELPQNPSDWGNLALRFGLLLTLLLLAGRLAISRLCRLAETSACTEPKALSRSWLWLSVGLALLFASYGLTGGVFLAVVVPANLCMVWGELTLAWQLRRMGKPELPAATPFTHLFGLVLAGITSLFLNPPAILLTPFWALVLIAYLVDRRVRKSPGPLPFLERAGVGFTPWLARLALILTVFGWSRIALSLVMVWFTLVLSAQLGLALTSILARTVERLPATGGRPLVAGLAMGFGTPLLWLIVAVTTILWVAAYPGGAYLMQHAMELNVAVGSASLNLLRLVWLVALFYLTRSAVTLGRTFLSGLPGRWPHLDRGVVPSLQAGLTYALWAIFGLILLAALGVSLTSVTVILGGLSVGLGFGLQTIFNNFFSGLILIFGRSLQEGDVVQLGETWGEVRKINIRSTMVETYEGAVIIVPNSELVSNRLINWTRNNQIMRRQINVGVAYGSDVALVKQLLLDTAAAHKNVLSTPEPFVQFRDFGASSLDFTLFFFADISQGLGTASDLRAAIVAAFRAHGIEIPFPQQDVHVRDIPAASSGKE